MKKLTTHLMLAALMLAGAFAGIALGGDEHDTAAAEVADLLASLSAPTASDTISENGVEVDLDSATTAREILIMALEFADRAADGIDVQADLVDLRQRVRENHAALIASWGELPDADPEPDPVPDVLEPAIPVPATPAEFIGPAPERVAPDPRGAAEAVPVEFAAFTPEDVSLGVPDEEVPDPAPGEGPEASWRRIMTDRLDDLEKRVEAAERRLAAGEEVGS